MSCMRSCWRGQLVPRKRDGGALSGSEGVRIDVVLLVALVVLLAEELVVQLRLPAAPQVLA